MAEVPPERMFSNGGQPYSFNQTPASSSRNESDSDSKAPLPKGVVLDKDGKPYVPLQTFYYNTKS
jgi:FAD-linked sulfhydryl oxidase